MEVMIFNKVFNKVKKPAVKKNKTITFNLDKILNKLNY